jgi:hypothetical protein
MDIHALIEKFVVEQITSIGLIPTRQELLSKFKIPDTKLKEIIKGARLELFLSTINSASVSPCPAVLASISITYRCISCNGDIIVSRVSSPKKITRATCIGSVKH